jgi:hypothetical protein
VPGVDQPGYDVGGMTGAHTICLFAGTPGYPRSRAGGTEIAAHEAAHVLQYELGCARRPARAAYWTLEGMAEDLAWRATSDRRYDDLVGDAEIAMLTSGLSAVGLRPFEATERGLSYAEALRGVLEAEGDQPRRLVDFCRGVGRGTTWPRAFAAHFGATPNAFYTRFADIRRAVRDSVGG